MIGVCVCVSCIQEMLSSLFMFLLDFVVIWIAFGNSADQFQIDLLEEKKPLDIFDPVLQKDKKKTHFWYQTKRGKRKTREREREIESDSSKGEYLRI